MSSSANPLVVLITGANKGIGLGAVELLAKAHPDYVILLATRVIKNGEEAIAQLKQEQPSTSFSNVHIVQLDVTDQKSIDAAAQLVSMRYGGLDVLINNSGIQNFDRVAMSENSAASEEVFNVNVFGVQRMNDTFLPLLTKRPNPIVVDVGSEVGAYINKSYEPGLQKFIDSAADQWTVSTPRELVDDWMQATHGDKSKPARWKWLPAQKSLGSYVVSKSIVNGYGRWYARQHPELRLAVVCPGHCATALNKFSGARSPQTGGASIIWPLNHEFESGQFYLDGEKKPFIGTMGMEDLIAHVIRTTKEKELREHLMASQENK